MQTLTKHTLFVWMTSIILLHVSDVYGVATSDSSSEYTSPPLIERDVIVVGGGSGGT